MIIIANPFFVIRTRLQTSKQTVKITPLIINIYHKEGLKGFQKGLSSSLLNNTKLVLQFPLYDYLKKNYNTITSSFIAKFISNTLFYPSDLIRTNQRNSPIKITMLNATKQIYNIGGLFGFYRGVILYNCISIPNFVLMMLILENMKKLYK